MQAMQVWSEYGNDVEDLSEDANHDYTEVVRSYSNHSS